MVLYNNCKCVYVVHYLDIYVCVYVYVQSLRAQCMPAHIQYTSLMLLPLVSSWER